MHKIISEVLFIKEEKVVKNLSVIVHYSDRPRVSQGNVISYLKLFGKIIQVLGKRDYEVFFQWSVDVV